MIENGAIVVNLDGTIGDIGASAEVTAKYKDSDFKVSHPTTPKFHTPHRRMYMMPKDNPSSQDS